MSHETITNNSNSRLRLLLVLYNIDMINISLFQNGLCLQRLNRALSYAYRNHRDFISSISKKSSFLILNNGKIQSKNYEDFLIILKWLKLFSLNNTCDVLTVIWWVHHMAVLTQNGVGMNVIHIFWSYQG